MKKVFGVIKKIIIGICAVVFFAFVIGMTILLLNFNDYGVTQFDDKSLIIIRDDISSDVYKKGDLVIVKAKKLENIQPGDELFVYKVSENNAVTIDLGKVDKVYTKEKAISYQNGSTYAFDFVIGESEKIYNDIGSILAIIESKWGFLFIVLVPSFLIFIYELYALIIEIKYGKDDIVPVKA